jgi:hypothetical protein
MEPLIPFKFMWMTLSKLKQNDNLSQKKHANKTCTFKPQFLNFESLTPFESFQPQPQIYTTQRFKWTINVKKLGLLYVNLKIQAITIPYKHWGINIQDLGSSCKLWCAPKGLAHGIRVNFLT